MVQFLQILYYIFSGLVILVTLLPLIPSSYWVFRVADFGKIQVFYVGLATFIIAWFLPYIPSFGLLQSVLLLLLFYHAITLIKYTHFYPVSRTEPKHTSSDSIHVFSANVYQFNTDYAQFVNLIKKEQPDIFLTMESNGAWENALTVLEEEYPYSHKIGLENTYGMHLYSKLVIKNSKTHYFVADDIPSVEAEIVTKDGFKFVFFGVHPPPPSPTEEATSKERDGDLLSVAKRVKELHLPTLVVGDFNNVAWSKSSILFRKTSELIDPRIGHGFVSTFHAKYRWLRFPIDLIFHSTDVFITELKTLPNFGSDHLAINCKFFIDGEIDDQEDQVATATAAELEEAEEMIQDGIEEESDRAEVVTE